MELTQHPAEFFYDYTEELLEIDVTLSNLFNGYCIFIRKDLL